jgi:hypothetical protein
VETERSSNRVNYGNPVLTTLCVCVCVYVCARARACVRARYDVSPRQRIMRCCIRNLQVSFFCLTCADNKQSILKITGWKIDFFCATPRLYIIKRKKNYRRNDSGQNTSIYCILNVFKPFATLFVNKKLAIKFI